MVTYPDIEAAHRRISPYIRRTPVLTSSHFDARTGARLHFKCENFQKTGSFKIRGAANAVFSLTDGQCTAGVATHSSGNHGAALAQAAAWRGITATVVVPDTAPAVKIDAVRGYGADVVFCEPSLQAREETLAKIVEKTGVVFIPPYNHEEVIAGQGTAAKELLEEVASLDMVLVPVGGGGLAAGTAIAVSHLGQGTRVIGVEPDGADDAARSLKQGKLLPCEDPQTVADGLRTSLGDITFPLIRNYLEDIVTVSEEAIRNAMRDVWERMKILIEPSAAVPLAAVLSGKLDTRGAAVGIILTGGNVDLARYFENL